ncbi:MAG: PQQ-binding-like beta-propeller repeat protein [Candidatus Eisenbacteria sp.]|nr:PQQ-binding-like beta-propeller repeat protein [Candidatus Eisenbacteria bacterium]
MRPTACLVIGILFLAASGMPEAQLQESAWPMFHRDLQHTGRCDAIGPDMPSLNWCYPIGATVMASPTIDADGTVYIGAEDGEFFAINSNGTLKWNHQISTGSYPYIRGAAAIDVDNIIYIGQWDTQKAYAFYPDGTPKWSSVPTGAISFSGPAVGSDGTIYVLGCGLTRGLSALNPEDGSSKWRITTGSSPSAWNEGSPAMGHDGRIYFGSGDAHIYCADTSGTVVWAYPTVGQITRGPAVGFDGTIYAGSGDAVDYNFYALNPDGTLKWTLAGGNRFWSAPAIGEDGTIYVGCDDQSLYAIEDCTTYGQVKWTFPTCGYMSSSPAIDGDGTIYVGSHNARMYAINPDGTLKWQYTTGGMIDSSPAIGADGTIYFGSRDGLLYALGPGPAGIRMDPYNTAGLPLQVHSNPVCGPLQLQLSGQTQQEYEVLLYDITGRAVSRRRGAMPQGSLDLSIPTEGRAPGVYFVRARVGGLHSVQKITILR